jgi:hypothetical protein
LATIDAGPVILGLDDREETGDRSEDEDVETKNQREA